MIKDIQKLLINKTVSRNDATLVMNKGVFEDQRWFHRMKSQDGSKVKKYSSRWWWWRRPKATFFGVCCQYSVKQQKKIKFCVNCVIVLSPTRMKWLNVFCWACCCGSCSPLYSGHSKEKNKKNAHKPGKITAKCKLAWHNLDIVKRCSSSTHWLLMTYFCRFVAKKRA